MLTARQSHMLELCKPLPPNYVQENPQIMHRFLQIMQCYAQENPQIMHWFLKIMQCYAMFSILRHL